MRVAFKDYVIPLEEELQKIMVQYKILNEGELFCTTLMFNLDDESNTKFIGDPGKKDDDAVKQLNQKLKELQIQYISKMKDDCEKRHKNK